MGLQCLIRTNRACRVRTTVILMREEQWGPRQAAFRDCRKWEIAEGVCYHGQSGFAHEGEVQAELGCFEPEQIDGVHQKQESSQIPGSE